MKKWLPRAAPDDQGAWGDVINMWPSSRGTYEMGYISSGTDVTGASAGAVSYAATFHTLTTIREYIVDATHLWEYSSGALTDRTNGVTVSTAAMMAQFGNVTICVMGPSTATVSSSGGNFSALAGAPQAHIVLVHANAVLMFNTNTSADGWAASDVGDHTNWTTGEAASGRIYDTPGPITAALSWGGHVYVFKPGAIYRMTYVGGDVKWQIQIAWKGHGIYGATIGGNDHVLYSKFQAVATNRGIAFVCSDGLIGTQEVDNKIYLFDGSSPPVWLNPLTTMYGGSYVVLRYNPAQDMLTVCPSWGADGNGYYDSGATLIANYYYYSFASDAWGRGYGGSGEIVASGTNTNRGVLLGDYVPTDPGGYENSKPVFWAYRGTSNILVRSTPTRPSTGRVTSFKYGGPFGKSTFKRLIPLLRRRTDLGSDSVVVVMRLYQNREDTSHTYESGSLSESSFRRVFDLGTPNSDYYATFQIAWNALDVDVDDIEVEADYVPKSK